LDVFQFSSSLISFALLPINAYLFLSFWTVILSVIIKFALFQAIFALSEDGRKTRTVESNFELFEAVFSKHKLDKK
jgi:hypothetical protein